MYLKGGVWSVVINIPVIWLFRVPWERCSRHCVPKVKWKHRWHCREGKPRFSQNFYIHFPRAGSTKPHTLSSGNVQTVSLGAGGKGCTIFRKPVSSFMGKRLYFHLQISGKSIRWPASLLSSSSEYVCISHRQGASTGCCVPCMECQPANLLQQWTSSSSGHSHNELYKGLWCVPGNGFEWTIKKQILFIPLRMGSFPPYPEILGSKLPTPCLSHSV